MERAGEDFFTYVSLPQGTHEYKFLVNEQIWCYSKFSPLTADREGNINNLVIVSGESYFHENLVS